MLGVYPDCSIRGRVRGAPYHCGDPKELGRKVGAVALLSAWASFYVIAGTSAGALIGLTFVVITLTSSIRRTAPAGAVNAYNTPTVVHFSQVLFMSAALSAPWPALWPVSVLLGLAGLGGIVYALIVYRRIVEMAQGSAYRPVLEDWLGHVVLPLIGYIVVLLAALLLPGSTQLALFGVAGVLLLLLFVGIHNAWDTAAFVVLTPSQSDERPSE